jgi:hypothetical protein
VSPADRRLTALLAAFAPERCASLVARLGTASAAAVAEQVERLAAAPRHERLAALAGALSAGRAAPAQVSAVARAERPRVAALVGSLGAGTVGAAPALVRLCRQRLGS